MRLYCLSVKAESFTIRALVRWIGQVHFLLTVRHVDALGTVGLNIGVGLGRLIVPPTARIAGTVSGLR